MPAHARMKVQLKPVKSKAIQRIKPKEVQPDGGTLFMAREDRWR
jgi:hypothetical protein